MLVFLGVEPVLKLAQYSMSRALTRGAQDDANRRSTPVGRALLQRGDMIMNLVQKPLPIESTVREHVKSSATQMKQVNHNITRPRKLSDGRIHITSDVEV
jgi:hypothetical protein